MLRKMFVGLVLMAVAVGAVGVAPAKAQDTVTITLWIMPNGPDPAGAIEAEIAAFEAMYPNINVEYEILDWGSAWTRITTAATSGEGPDVSQLGTTWVAAIDAMGALEPLEVDAAKFTPASFNTATPIGKDMPASVPWFTDVRAIIYRTDVFEQLGLDADEAFTDWNTFVDALQTIKDSGIMDDSGNEPMAPFAFPGKNDWNVPHNFIPWIWSNGGDWFNEDLTAAAINSPEAVEAIFFYANLYNQGFTPSDTLEKNSAEIDGGFQDGKYAMIISGPWMVSGSRVPEDQGGWSEKVAAQNMAVHEIPNSPNTGEHYTFVGGSNLTLWKSSAHKEEAQLLIDFLTTPESQVRYCTTIGMLPAVVEALDDPAISEDPDYSVFKAAVANGKSYPALAAWGAIENELVTTLGALWDDVAAGKVTTPEDIQERLDAAADAIDILLLTE